MTDEERREIEELLPFLANGSLEGAELARVEAAVAADDALAGELAALQVLRTTLQEDETVRGPGEFGHARLMRALDQEVATAAQRSRPILWQMAAAALLAVVMGQAWWLNRDAQPEFTLAGAQAEVTVAFVPTATEAQIRTLLLEAGFEIVSGPSALGLYELAPLEDVELEAAANALREAVEIVESVDVPEE